MMKSISNIDSLFKASNTSSTPVFADLYEQNKPGAAIAKTPTTEQLKEIYGKAYKEGYLRGEREARANVDALVQKEIASLKLSLQQLIEGLHQAIVQHSEKTSLDILNLALDIAKIMVKSHIAIRTDAVLPVVKHAIELLPSLQKPLRITLHPDDAALITTEIAACFDTLEFTILKDPLLDRGGCLLDSEINVVDASNAQRWKLLAESLGCSNDWFEVNQS
jgi:flagellar assembly protein FliH